MSRIRRVESERELEKLIDDYVTRGYTIKEQGQYSAMVKAKDWGTPAVHGFVFIFTFAAAAILFDAVDASAGAVWVVALVANGVYAAYSWLTSEEIVIKVDDDAQ